LEPENSVSVQPQSGQAQQHFPPKDRSCRSSSVLQQRNTLKTRCSKGVGETGRLRIATHAHARTQLSSYMRFRGQGDQHEHGAVEKEAHDFDRQLGCEEPGPAHHSVWAQEAGRAQRHGRCLVSTISTDGTAARQGMNHSEDRAGSKPPAHHARQSRGRAARARRQHPTA